MPGQAQRPLYSANPARAGGRFFFSDWWVRPSPFVPGSPQPWLWGVPALTACEGRSCGIVATRGRGFPAAPVLLLKANPECEAADGKGCRRLGEGGKCPGSKPPGAGDLLAKQSVE